jgi:hypothetical protein
MKRIIFMALLIVTLVGCGTGKSSRLTIDSKESVRDSTFTTKRFVLKDTLISIPKDSLSFWIPFKDLSETPIVKTNGRTTAKVSYKNNKLNVQCLTEEYQQIITMQNEVIETLREIIKSTSTVSESETIKIPWYMQPTTWIIAAVLYGLISILLKIFNPFKR